MNRERSPLTPLTPEEVSSLQQELGIRADEVVSIHKLLCWWSGRFARSGKAAGYEREDLVQEGWAVARAAIQYPGRRCSLTGLVSTFVSRKFQDLTDKDLKEVELDGWMDGMSVEPAVIATDEFDMVRQGLHLLSRTERSVVQRRYWKGEAIETIAASKGVCTRTILRILGSARAKLRHHMERPATYSEGRTDYA